MIFQFPDIVEFCEELANDGKTVIVAALDGTFQRKVRIHRPLMRIVSHIYESLFLGIQYNSGFSASGRKGR